MVTFTKKILLLFIFVLTLCISSNAAWFDFFPTTITQPNGEKIECFTSGDEFYNWLHDADGYTIVQANDGYYYYAISDKDEIKPSSIIAGSMKASLKDVKPWLTISNEVYQKRRKQFEVYGNERKKISKSVHTGTLNNIAVYIRFKGEAEFNASRSYYDEKLNNLNGTSLRNYYQEVSYGKLDISSTHYPACALNTNFSYQDDHYRNYYKPFNISTNPAGYKTDIERRNREHNLIVNAVNWLKSRNEFPTSINFDSNSDGNIDNILFIVKGSPEDWGGILWAHRWSLFSQNLYINGKRVYDYTFQPEAQTGVHTLCHEMFHTLGATDLYHYHAFKNLIPVGHWDLMQSGSGHMGAYMKWKYSNGQWISNIPEIKSSGTYELNPLTTAYNNCFKIPLFGSTNEYLVLEYRKKAGLFESDIPGSGLVAYRINKDFEGNSGFNGTTIYDEVYVYRPGGSVTTNGNFTNGDYTKAHFSSNTGRTSFNFGTNPKFEKQNGNYSGISISNISYSSNKISFDISISAFTDTDNHWAENEINYMRYNGYLAGYDDGSFKPDKNLSRAEFATMIATIINPSIDPDYADRNFSDISEHWAEDYILQAARAGYMNGYPDGSFKPNNTITKTEILVTISNGIELYGGDVNDLSYYFSDASSIANWAKQSIANILSHSMIPNYPNLSQINPSQNATRAEAAVLMYQTLYNLGWATYMYNPYIVQYNGGKLNIESNNLNTEIDLRLYPNPAKSEIQVYYNQNFDHSSQIQVLNLQGIELYTNVLKGSNTTIDLTSYSPGVYMIRINSNTTSKSELFIIQ